MSCLCATGAKDEHILGCLSSLAAAAEGGITKGTMAYKRNATKLFVHVLCWIDSELSTLIILLFSFKVLVIGVASTKLGLEGLMAEDCHWCSHKTLIF